MKIYRSSRDQSRGFNKMFKSLEIEMAKELKEPGTLQRNYKAAAIEREREVFERRGIHMKRVFRNGEVIERVFVLGEPGNPGLDEQSQAKLQNACKASKSRKNS